MAKQSLEAVIGGRHVRIVATKRKGHFDISVYDAEAGSLIAAKTRVKLEEA